MDEQQSERHQLRGGSLLSGLLTITIAVLFLLDDSGVVKVDAVVAAAVLLVVYSGTNVIRLLARALRPRAPG